jgi:hypothetical protein
MFPRMLFAVLVASLVSSCQLTTNPVHVTTVPRELLPNAQIDPGRSSSGYASATFERDYVRFVVRKTASNANVGMWVTVDADANRSTGLVNGSPGVEFVFGQHGAAYGNVDLRFINQDYGWSFSDPASASFPVYTIGRDWVAYIPISYFGSSRLCTGWTPYIRFTSTEVRSEELAAIP